MRELSFSPWRKYALLVFKQASRKACGFVSDLSLLVGLLQTAHACTLSVHIDGFRNGKGVIGCVVFQKQAGWPEQDDLAFNRKAIPVANQTKAVISIPDVPPGRYAIVVLHDENANHRLDRNLFRVPKEGFGFANNPRIGLSAPSWKDASVQVSCPTTEVTIHLVYK